MSYGAHLGVECGFWMSGVPWILWSIYVIAWRGINNSV